MIIAKSTVIVGSQTFLPGQTVTGLSPMDKEWMQKAGYVREAAEHNNNPNKKGKKEQKDG